MTMIDLTNLREQIDEIDSQIVKLYEQRMEVAEQVAKYKIETGKQVFDKTREREKIEAVKNLTHNAFNTQGIEELFGQIMAISRKRQYGLLVKQGAYEIEETLPFERIDSLPEIHGKVIFQGAEGAYSQEAMKQYFGEDIDSLRVDTFRDAMVALSRHEAEYAVLPIENSTAGVVGDIYDLLVEFDNYIIGEQVIKIEHCLLGLPESNIDQIKTVYSHPQSLKQSAGFLKEHPDWQQIHMLNNAYATQKVKQDGDKTQAAIAGEYAGRVNGLTILQKEINQSESNATRFIIVTNQKKYLKNAGKISVCFEVAHESGSLYQMLSHFIYNGLNLNRIESRPIEDKDWEYRFFIDFHGNLTEEAVINALTGLREEALQFKVLGNY